MVTCLGRSGTTLLMRLLGAHPGIVIDARHPHETRCVSYWTHALNVLGSPGGVLEPVEWISYFDNRDHVLPHPFHSGRFVASERALTWLGGEYVEQLARFTREALAGFYRCVAQDAGKAHATLFAEKVYPNHIPDVLREAVPEAREIICVRDPRDMLCSILQFLRRPGRSFLGHDASETVDELVTGLARELNDLVEAWRRRCGTAALVRYEDLVAAPQSVLRYVFEHLQLDSSDELIERIVADGWVHDDDFQQHRTSRSVAASVGRWRNELPAELLDRCEQRFGYALETFGYVPAQEANAH